MNTLMKIIGIAICATVLSSVLKKTNKEYSIAITIVTSIIIFVILISIFGTVIDRITDIASKSDINLEYISTILKIIAIAFLSEYSVAVLEDAGESAISKKVELAGKLIIFVMALPIIESLVKLVLTIV